MSPETLHGIYDVAGCIVAGVLGFVAGRDSREPKIQALKEELDLARKTIFDATRMIRAMGAALFNQNAQAAEERKHTP